ncbi:MAG: Iron-sulfur cluster carrier protein [Anaerolineae bacterium]|nr:Iron-sulfur cluster carrier protein [Anaerolineae bacterium]
MELRQYFALARKWGWLILLLVGLAAAGSYLYSRAISPTYRATAILLVGQEQSSANPTASDLNVSSNLAQAYALLASQPSVLQAVAQDIHWPDSWESLYFVISANAPAGGQTINVSALASTPERAQEMANAAANQIIAQSPISRQQQAADTRREFVTNQQELLQAQIIAAQNQVSDLTQQIALETDPVKLDALNARLAALQTKIEGAQRTYIQMGGLLTQSTERYITLISPAPLPPAPISPNLLQNVLLAAAAGLVLAAGVILLLEYLDDTIKSAEDVRREMGAATLGGIARIHSVHKPADALITLKHPRSAIAEEYRTLRTNLRYAGIENPGGALLITSANPGEGKTTTATNLALAMAQAGKRVALVDADLRRPNLHRVFELDNANGLTSLFLDQPPTLDEVLRETAIPGLVVLTSSEPPPNPAELLDSRRMTEILQALRQKFDVVILDSPPALVVADASILASRCSGVLLVVDSGRTRTEAARQVIETMNRSQVKVLGVALNRVGGRGRGYYYQYNYKPYYSSPKSNAKTPARTFAPLNGNASNAGNGHHADAVKPELADPQLDD